MSLVKTTGWVSIVDGGSTLFPINVANIVSARLRWRGKDKRLTDSDSNSGSTSASFPSVPIGWTRSGGTASYSVTFHTGQAYDHGSVSVSAPGGSDSTSWSLPPYSSTTVKASAGCSGTGTAEGSYTKESHGYTSVSGHSTTARVNYYKDIPSEALVATINGVAVDGPASLAGEVVSDWYDVSNLVIGNNTIAHSIATSGLADFEIEYTYQPYPPAPTRLSPESYTLTDDSMPTFEVTLNKATGSDATAMHGRILLSTLPSMSSPTVHDSSVSQSGWEYWDGDSWEDFPAGGVAPGAKVRYTPTSPISPGTWYWTATAKNDWAWGLPNDVPWVLRRVLSVNALEGYALAVGAKTWKCLDLIITESSNGELSTIEFVVSNWPDKITGKTAHDLINYGDPVYLSVYDSTGKEQQYLGRVFDKQPDDLRLKVIATMGDKVLADRLASADYLETDIGTALAAMVTADCAPLLDTGIEDPFGLTTNLVSKNQQVMSSFQEVFRTFGLLFWVETHALDWIIYLADPTKLTAQGILVEFPMEGVS